MFLFFFLKWLFTLRSLMPPLPPSCSSRLMSTTPTPPSPMCADSWPVHAALPCTQGDRGQVLTASSLTQWPVWAFDLCNLCARLTALTQFLPKCPFFSSLAIMSPGFLPRKDSFSSPFLTLSLLPVLTGSPGPILYFPYISLNSTPIPSPGTSLFLS